MCCCITFPPFGSYLYDLYRKKKPKTCFSGGDVSPFVLFCCGTMKLSWENVRSIKDRLTHTLSVSLFVRRLKMENNGQNKKPLLFQACFFFSFFPLTIRYGDVSSQQVHQISCRFSFSSVFRFVAHKPMLLLNFTSSTVQTPQRRMIQWEEQRLCGPDHET